MGDGEFAAQPTLDDRTFIDAVLYRARTGVPWRDLPERFGSWKTIYNRFRTGRCAATGRRSSRHSSSRKKTRLSSSMHPLFEPTRMLRAAKGIISNALGHSRGGFTTKVHALVDRKGRPLHIELTQGQRHESTVAEDIIAKHARGKALIADTGYDSDAIEVCSETSESRRSSMRTRHERTSRDSIAALRVPVSCRDVLPQFEALSRLATRFEKTAGLPLALQLRAPSCGSTTCCRSRWQKLGTAPRAATIPLERGFLPRERSARVRSPSSRFLLGVHAEAPAPPRLPGPRLRHYLDCAASP